MKLALLSLHKELVGEKKLENIANMLNVTLFIWGEDKDIVQVNKHFLRLMKTQSQTHWMYPQNPINTRLKRVVETMLSGKKCLEATVVHLIKMPEMMYNPNLRFITKLR